jgi:hypothetical protein
MDCGSFDGGYVKINSVLAVDLHRPLRSYP